MKRAVKLLGLTAAFFLALNLSAVHWERAEAASEEAGEGEKSLPAYWNSGEQGRKPLVRSQGSDGTCWALTAASALEASLLPEERTVFSGEHIALGDAFSSGLEEGGDYVMIMAYLSSWLGPVTEEEDPSGDGVSPQGLSQSVHVQEIQMLQGAELEEIKEKIMEFGAIQTSLYMNRAVTEEGAEYYNSSASAYYYPQKETQDHDVLILGWDDSFPRESFARDPGRDGAFICLNTWGEDFGQEGIFYVSYEDANIAGSGLAYTRIDPADNYGNIYQHDVYGWLGQQGYGAETCWFSNVYTAKGQEELEAVGFYAAGDDTVYELYLVRDFLDEESFSEMVYVQSGALEYPGYYTVDFQTPQTLEAGERFAVAVRVRTAGETSPVAVEYAADEYSQGVTLQGKESYISPDGRKWEQTQRKYGSNVCLKAFTS